MHHDLPDTESLRDRLMQAQEKNVGNSITVFLSTRRPMRLEYTIDNLELERENAVTHKEWDALEKKFELFHGMYATFGFQAGGIAQCVGMSFKATLSVNALNSSEFLMYGREGRIGDGSFKRGEFSFQLHLAPSMVRDLLSLKSQYSSVPLVSADETDMLLGPEGDTSLSPMYGYEAGLGIDDPFFLMRLELELMRAARPDVIGYSIRTLYVQ